MAKIFIQPSPERADAINKNLEERGQKEAREHEEKMKNHKSFKAHKTKAEYEADLEAETAASMGEPRRI